MPNSPMVARTPPNPDPNYRPDIDGLRAIAVLSVVGFHAFPQAIRGGFIGVDIFFVISGYLISTILFENLQHGRFSLVQFYCRRIRRIFPALLLVLITVLVFGWFALFANEYQQLGKHVAAGAAFIANYIFWSESGYFDTAAITKPLLHLWSLGIEEQFYILWPVILWLGWRVKTNLLAVALGLAVVSFGLNLYGIRHDVVATFYAPQTRFWELLSGSLMAWLMVFRPAASDRLMARVDGWLGRIMGRDTAGLIANLLSVLGLLFIVGGVAIFHSGLSFPGMRALIPVIGAVLIIAAGAESWLNRTLLSHRILVWFGLISYPLYLWHWPILSLVTTIEGENLSPLIVSAALLLAVALAWLTFRWVERPIRTGGLIYSKVAVLSILMIMVATAGFVIFKNGGLANRHAEMAVASFKEIIGPYPHLPSHNLTCERLYPEFKQASYCLISKEAPAQILLFGDSHSNQYYKSLVKALPDKVILNLGVDYQDGIKCSPSNSGSGSSDYPCGALLESALNIAVQSPSITTIVYGSQWIDPNLPIYSERKKTYFPNFRSTMTQIVDSIKNQQKQFVFIYDNPGVSFHMSECFDTRPLKFRIHKTRADCGTPRNEQDAKNLPAIQIIRELIAPFPAFQTYDPTALFCDSQYCNATRDGKPLIYDFHHLTLYGADLVVEDLLAQIPMSGVP